MATLPDAKIKSIKEFSEGYNNRVYDISLSSGNYVFKIINSGGSEKRILLQKNILKMICRKFKNFPLAKIIKSDFSKKVIDKSYILSEKLEGQTLQVLHSKIKNKEKLYEEIGELYGKMHSFKFKQYGGLDISLNRNKGHKSWYLLKCEEVKKIFKKIEENKLLSLKELKSNKVFFYKNKSILKKEVGPCLCHGDSATSNIIISKSGQNYAVSGIIDFEFACAGGATQDLFQGIRSFEKKYSYRKNLVAGHSKWSRLPLEWEELALLYHWIEHLNRLTKIKDMKWRDLDNLKALKRKKDLRKKSLHALESTIKKWPNLHLNQLEVRSL